MFRNIRRREWTDRGTDCALKERLARKNRDEKEGVGLWNVNQRLVNYYGEQSSLQFGGSIWKGLCVSFVIDGKERL